MDKTDWMQILALLGEENDVSAAQAERLHMLSEECGEIVQKIAKWQRGGPQYRPFGGPKDNRTLLEDEIRDFLAVLAIMLRAGDISEIVVTEADIERRLEFTRHQD